MQNPIATGHPIPVGNSGESIFLKKESLPRITDFTDMALVVHGLDTHHDTAANQRKRSLLVQAGYATRAMDLFAHGKSSGSRTELSATNLAHGYLAALRYIREEHPGLPLTVISGSIGAHTALVGNLLAEKEDCKNLLPETLVLMAPAVDYLLLAEICFGPAMIAAWKEKGTIKLPNLPELPYLLYSDALENRYSTQRLAAACSGTIIISFSQADELIPHSTVSKFISELQKNNNVSVTVHCYSDIPHSMEPNGTVDPLDDVMKTLHPPENI